MMTLIAGSILTSIGMLVCVGATFLVALAFILYRAITGSAQAGSQSHQWEPHEPEKPRYRDGDFERSSPFGGIPTTGPQSRPDDEDQDQ